LGIGVGKDLSQIYLLAVVIAVIVEGLAPTLVVSVENTETSKAMVKWGILETGRARVPFPPFHSRSVAQEMEGAHEQMMAQLQKVSEIEEHLLLSGARAAPDKGLKMEAQDLRDAISRNALLLSAPLQLLSRITNGVPRWSLISHLPSPQLRLEKAVKLLLLPLWHLPFQQAGRSWTLLSVQCLKLQNNQLNPQLPVTRKLTRLVPRALLILRRKRGRLKKSVWQRLRRRKRPRREQKKKRKRRRKPQRPLKPRSRKAWKQPTRPKARGQRTGIQQTQKTRTALPLMTRLLNLRRFFEMLSRSHQNLVHGDAHLDKGHHRAHEVVMIFREGPEAVEAVEAVAVVDITTRDAGEDKTPTEDPLPRPTKQPQPPPLKQKLPLRRRMVGALSLSLRRITVAPHGLLPLNIDDSPGSLRSRLVMNPTYVPAHCNQPPSEIYSALSNRTLNLVTALRTTPLYFLMALLWRSDRPSHTSRPSCSQPGYSA
jgi:hypothetical protein